MKKEDANTLSVKKRPDESEADSLGRVCLSPAVQGALTLQGYAMPGLDAAPLDSLVASLQAQNDAVNVGDFQQAENILTSQAHTLDAIFNSLARNSASAEYMDKMEAYLKLALKAQSQCRSTLEALAEVKAPKSVSFVRQANISHGHQQVNNNGEYEKSGSPARKEAKTAKQTKQVGDYEKQTLDARSEATPSRAYPRVGAVDEGHWS